jgi:hypothetical protein
MLNRSNKFLEGEGMGSFKDGNDSIWILLVFIILILFLFGLV